MVQWQAFVATVELQLRGASAAKWNASPAWRALSSADVLGRGASSFLALLVGTATGLFIAFFHTQGWQDQVIRWAQEHKKSEIALHVTQGSYAGTSWRQWAAIGVVGTAILMLGWLLLSASVALPLRNVPHLRGAVREEDERRWGRMLTILGVIAVIPVAIAILATLAAAGSGGHHHDARDIDGS